MNKPKVLVAPFPRSMEELFNPEDAGRLRECVEVLWGRDEDLPPSQLEDFLPDIWAFVGGQIPLSTDRLEKAANLRTIVEVTGSFPPTIDYMTCFAKGIRVLSCAPAFGPQVAEMSLALTLAACRGIVAADADFRVGKEEWQGDRPTDFSLFDQSVGFIGFGAIGRCLLPLLEPFRCTVRVFDPWLPRSLIARAGCAPSTLEEVLETCRVLYVFAVPTPENKGLLGRAQIAQIRNRALIVLVSRAHLVDFEALTDALNTDRLLAAIDVFPEEPMPLDAKIRYARNVLLSPHRGASIRVERQRIGQMVVDDLELLANDLPPALLQIATPETIRRRFSLKR